MSADERRDAKRWALILSLTTIELSEMNCAGKDIWTRFVKGGWYTDDLVSMIDAAIDHHAKSEKATKELR